MRCKFLGVGLGSGGFLGSWLCGGGLLLDFLSGLLGFFGEFLFDVDGVAGDVFAALAEEEPDEDENRTAEDEEAVFDRIGPVGSEEDYSINDAEADSIEVATGEDDFLGEREITSGEGIFGAIVGVAEEFTVEDKLENATNDGVVDDDSDTDCHVDTEGTE